jgi:hypothetical protein
VEALRHFHELRDTSSVAAVMEGLAVVAWKDGRFEAGGRLYGGADAIRRDTGQPRVPDEEEVSVTVRAGLAEHLGAEGLAAAIAAGSQGQIDETVAWVLETFADDA